MWAISSSTRYSTKFHRNLQKKLEKQDFDIDLAYSNTAFFYSIRQ